MRARRSSLLALALLVPLQAWPSALHVYGRLPSIEEVALSPDGSRIAFTRTEDDNRVVKVYALADHKLLRGLRVGQQKLRGIYWAGNEHLMIMTSVTSLPVGYWGYDSEWFQLQVYDLKDGALYLVGSEPDRLNHIELMNAVAGVPAIRQLDGHTVLFIRGVQTTDFGGLALVRLDLDTRTVRVIRPARPGNYAWLVDDAGEVAAEETYRSDARRWSLRIRRDGRSEEVASGAENLDVPRILGWGPDANTLVLERLEDGDQVWRLLSFKDGSLGPPMAEAKSLRSPIESRNRMVGGVQLEDRDEYVFFDPLPRYNWEMVLQMFPGEHVGLASHTEDFRKFVVRVEGKNGYRFALVDLDARSLTPLGDVYQDLKQPFEVRRITYPAADGTLIPAYLTLPRDKSPTNMPLIVLPHGGPEARDSASFQWWPQALADQGYAVLQPNFRGSALSYQFVSAGFGEWGRKMQTDLSDGVRYLAKQGLVDPKRVCIVGGSYGGYAALAGVALDPGIYRCAVAVAGIADIRRMLKWVNDSSNWFGRGDNPSARYWDRFMGLKGPDDPVVDAISPIKHLDAINVPVLLIHGRDDTVVDFEQSQEMYDALRRAKKEVELVTLKHEDHWLSRSETRLQMLESSVSFLRAHNSPD